MRLATSSKPRAMSVRFCEANIPDLPMTDSSRESTSAPTPMAKVSKAAVSSVFLTSSSDTRCARSVPSVNTTSVPKRRGWGAVSSCRPRICTASTTAPFRFVDGSLGR